MSMTPADRRVLTFYSFKGGVGRTMLLANTAYRLANKHGLRVIAVDWDLEAPGLHRFFGLSSDIAAKTNGVLDYFKSWYEALQRRTPEPPDVTQWLIPITDPKHAPRFGSLSLLTAGRLDEGYDRRLTDFDWQAFYRDSAGASAVETLRRQLINNADVVLIDSRTGFTDAGGICTIQIPDGVVLVTAPNQQSLEGIDRVARAIAHSPSSARSERARPRLWLVVSRVPLVEETYLAEQWFSRHAGWFAEGKKSGWWLAEDHPEGIQSHKIPHRSRWGFDEIVLSEAANADPDDLLVVPYDNFAETLLRWLRGEPPMNFEANRRVETPPDSEDLETLETAVADAERRGDIIGMATSLISLAIRLFSLRELDQAIRRAEQASGIFLSRGAHRQYVDCLFILGWALNLQQRYAEGSKTLARALKVSEQVEGYPFRIFLLRNLAEAYLEQGLQAEAERACSEAYALSKQFEDGAIGAGILWLIGNALQRLGSHGRAIEIFRRSARIAKSTNDPNGEVHALEQLLMLADAGETVEDAEAIRVRLAALESPQQQHAPNKKTRKKKP